MSGHVEEKRKSEVLRARVRQMIAAGYSVARMMKETGKSYVHISNIVAQEQAARTRTEGETPRD